MTAPRRPRDPYKHKSKLGAKTILIRVKADRIDSILDELLQVAKNDTVIAKITQAKVKAGEIIDIIEAEDQ